MQESKKSEKKPPTVLLLFLLIICVLSIIKLIAKITSAIAIKTEKRKGSVKKITMKPAGEFDKANRSVFGIDIFEDDPYLQEQMKLFSKQNAKNIQFLSQDSIDRDEQKLLKMVFDKGIDLKLLLKKYKKQSALIAPLLS